jgi:hypothetical protein
VPFLHALENHCIAPINCDMNFILPIGKTEGIE